MDYKPSWRASYVPVCSITGLVTMTAARYDRQRWEPRLQACASDYRRLHPSRLLRCPNDAEVLDELPGCRVLTSLYFDD